MPPVATNSESFCLRNHREIPKVPCWPCLRWEFVPHRYKQTFPLECHPDTANPSPWERKKPSENITTLHTEERRKSALSETKSKIALTPENCTVRLRGSFCWRHLLSDKNTSALSERLRERPSKGSFFLSTENQSFPGKPLGKEKTTDKIKPTSNSGPGANTELQGAVSRKTR